MNLDCKPSEPLSVIAFHGTADENVKYEGGMGSKQVGGPREDKPVATTITFWVKYDGCSATPQKSEKGNLRTDVYSGCKSGTADWSCAKSAVIKKPVSSANIATWRTNDLASTRSMRADIAQ